MTQIPKSDVNVYETFNLITEHRERHGKKYLKLMILRKGISCLSLGVTNLSREIEGEKYLSFERRNKSECVCLSLSFKHHSSWKSDPHQRNGIGISHCDKQTT